MDKRTLRVIFAVIITASMGYVGGVIGGSGGAIILLTAIAIGIILWTD